MGMLTRGAPMQRFMLLFHESPDMYRDLGPEEIQAIIEKYTAWRRRLEAAGRFVEGRKLHGHGRVVRSTGGTISVTDGPYVEGKELFGGYMIVLARSYDEAVGIAKDGPAALNGAVEVRQIELE
jgi:hypothetical protein